VATSLEESGFGVIIRFTGSLLGSRWSVVEPPAKGLGEYLLMEGLINIALRGSVWGFMKDI
jgi:hypothetical protein